MSSLYRDEVLGLLDDLRECGYEELPREIIVERRFPQLLWRGTPADWELEAELEWCERTIADPEVVDKQYVLLRAGEIKAELARRAKLAYRRATAPYEFAAVIERVRKVDVVGVITARAPRTAHSARREGPHIVRALCPFHDERTGSFAMWPELGGYRCFGCDAHGDCITAVMELDGRTFTEAVLDLCREYGITPPVNPKSLNAMNIPEAIS